MSDKVFTPLAKSGNDYRITMACGFDPVSYLRYFRGKQDEIVASCLDFALDMTTRGVGGHRPHRTGGQRDRGEVEILANAFQGKIAEFAFFEFLKGNGIACQPPILEVWGRGKWDSCDVVANGHGINVKSVKDYSQNLLLEVGDWDEAGRYVPNSPDGHLVQDFFVLLRMKPNVMGLLSENGLMDLDSVDEARLAPVIKGETWRFDIPGYINRNQLKAVIASGHILPQNAMLNGKTRMDASNYYVQAGDLSSADELIKELRLPSPRKGL